MWFGVFFPHHWVISPSKSSFRLQIKATEETTKAQNFKQPRKISPLDQLHNLSFHCIILQVPAAFQEIQGIHNEGGKEASSSFFVFIPMDFLI